MRVTYKTRHDLAISSTFPDKFRINPHKFRRISIMRRHIDIVDVFKDACHRDNYVKISAPMVRYSKLEFRTLLRRNNVDLCFTPMIVADSFCRSELARQNEFTTNDDDAPLVVQFAAKDTIDLITAAEMIAPYSDGVDLNCGCPQRWAMAAGYGCAILKQPELVHDMIRTVRRNLPGRFSVSVKLRLLPRDSTERNVDSGGCGDSHKTTVGYCRQMERCDATFITVHGRTPWQKTCEPVAIEAIAQVQRSVQIPVVANGDVRSLSDADRLYRETGCQGIMSARGILSNPALFTGTAITPIRCIDDWIQLGRQAADRMSFQCFHHHLTFMMEKSMRRKQRVVFNNLTRKDAVLAFLANEMGISSAATTAAPPRGACDDSNIRLAETTECKYDETVWSLRRNSTVEIPPTKSCQYAVRDGKFFEEFVAQDCTEDQDCVLNLCGQSIFNDST